MRHGAVAYFDADGRPVAPDEVPLTAEGREQAEAAATAPRGRELDRVISSGLPRTAETAALVAPGRERRDVARAARDHRRPASPSIPPDELEEAFVHAFHGIVPNDKRFLGGRDDRRAVRPRAACASSGSSRTRAWDTALVVAHGAVNRAILSHALLGERTFLGRFEQAPGCLNVLDVGAPTTRGSSAP